MFRSLVSEVVSRRMWPIPLVAILIAVAAPLLFMKSAPVGAPASTTAPPVATAGELPAGAERLVTTSDKAVLPTKRVKRKGKDPFASPKVAAANADPSPTATSAPPATSSGNSGAVVIKNSDGSTATMPATSTSGATSSAPKTSTTKTTPAAPTAPKTTTPDSSSSNATKTVTYVDVKFGKQMNTMTRFRVPRLQTFRAGGKVAAMFINYSESRHVAVFAVAPSTKVSGDVECREIKGVCRYVDIPEGSYARLRLRGENGALQSRRLDVVSVRELPLAGNGSARPRETTLSAATCLLKGLLKLPATVPSISADSCD